MQDAIGLDDGIQEVLNGTLQSLEEQDPTEQ